MDTTPADGAAAVMKLAAMVHLLEGSESPKYQRLIRRAEALKATSHHGFGSSSPSSQPRSIMMNNSNNNNNSIMMSKNSIAAGGGSSGYFSPSSTSSSSFYNNKNNHNSVISGSGGSGGGGSVLASEGATSMATLAGAHAARGDFLEASRLQTRAIDFELGQCRRGIREWKRAMDRTDRANEVSRFPEEPLLVKKDDLSMTTYSSDGNDEEQALCPPNLRGQLAVLADLFECLADYQESANNHLDCSASRRKARTLRAAISF